MWNCINNYLNGDMGNYAHSLPPQPLSGEDSVGNILSLCTGKDHFLAKWFLQMLTMPAPLSPHTPLPCCKLPVQYQFILHSMQSRYKATPCRASIQIILSFMPKQIVGRKRDIFLRETKAPFLPEKPWWVWTADSRSVHVGACWFPVLMPFAKPFSIIQILFE